MNEKTMEYCPHCGEKKLGFNEQKFWNCSSCGFKLYFNVASAVAALLFYQGNLLVIRRNKEPKKGLLDLPGGFVDPSETAEEALRRELMEELSLKVDDLEYLCSFPNQYPYKGILYRTCDMFFTGVISAIPQSWEKEEILDVQVLEPHELNSIDFAFTSVQKALEFWLNNDWSNEWHL